MAFNIKPMDRLPQPQNTNAAILLSPESGPLRSINRRLSLAAFVNHDAGNIANCSPSPTQFEKLVPSFVSKHVRNYIDDHINKYGNSLPSVTSSDPRSSAMPLSISSGQMDEIFENTPPSLFNSGLNNSANSRQSKPFIKISRNFRGDTDYIVRSLQPTAIEGWAAVVMCDVSGYSALTSFLADRGPDGAETLSKIMREYLNKIIQVISLHGGDIVKFVGDAVIIAWEYKPPSKKWHKFAETILKRDHPEWTTDRLSEGLVLAEQQRQGLTIVKAVECCLNVMGKLNNYRIEIPAHRSDPNSAVSERELRIHMGIGAGKIYNVHVGGEPGRWEHLIVGNAMDQIAQVLDLAKPGQVAMSRQAFESMKSCLDLSQVSIEYDSKKCIILNSLEKNAVSTLVPENDDECGDFLTLWDIQYSEQDRSGNVDIYKEYVAQSALFKLDSDIQSVSPFQPNQGINHLMSLNELRQVTTLFIKIGSLSFATVDSLEDNIKEQEDYIEEQRLRLKNLEADLITAQLDPSVNVEEMMAEIEASSTALEASKVVLCELQVSHKIALKESISRCQAAMTAVQVALKKFEGILRQFHVDDKGAVILAFFGLPPLAHKNDSSLGIQAGLFIRDEFKKHFDMFSLGITTGVVAIGGVGSSLRTEYALMGDSLNMAARIMSLPGAKLNVVCDERTYNLCQNSFEFLSLGQATVKGKSVPISIYLPIQQLTPQQNQTNKKRKSTEMVGRHPERQVVKQLLEEHKDNCRILVEGEGGQGISTFGLWIMDTAECMGNHVCVATSVESERSTPYFALRGICRDLIRTLGESAAQPDQGVLSSSASNRYRSLFASAILSQSQSCVISSSKSFKSSDPSVAKSGSVRPRFESRDLGASSGVVQQSIVGSVNALVMSEFEKEVRETLSIAPKCLGLVQSLALVFPEEFSAQNAELAATEAKHDSKGQQQDLLTLLVLVSQAISSVNRTLFLLPDMHYMDVASWEVLMHVAVKCPKIMVAILSYPVKHLLPAIVPFYESFVSQAHVILMPGLSVAEVSEVIIQTYQREVMQRSEKKQITPETGKMSITINPAISDKVTTVSGGNPLFVVSLVMSMMEKDSLKVNSLGLLTVYYSDGKESGSHLMMDDIIPGSDLHSLILSQFDRLEPMFQMFLKVASVLGQHFLLRDVLDYFESEQHETTDEYAGSEISIDTGLAFSTHVTDALISDINTFDKFSFLTFHGSSPESTEKNILVSFRNTIIRDSIYSIMLLTQRQALHLSFARFYERRLGQLDGRSGFLLAQKSTGTAENQLIIKVFEHYQKVNGYLEKKLTYLEQVAHLCYILGSTNESIGYYRDLINMPQLTSWTVRQPILRLSKDHVLTAVQRSRWHCELGDALVLVHKLDEAEIQYLEALRWVGFEIPKEHWRLAICTHFERRKLNPDRISKLAGQVKRDLSDEAKVAPQKEKLEEGGGLRTKTLIETQGFRLDVAIMSLIDLQMVQERDGVCQYLLMAANNLPHVRSSGYLTAALLAKAGFFMLASRKKSRRAFRCIQKSLEMIEPKDQSSTFTYSVQSPPSVEVLRQTSINPKKDKTNESHSSHAIETTETIPGILASRVQRPNGDKMYVVMVLSDAMRFNVLRGNFAKAREHGMSAMRLYNPDSIKNVTMKIRRTLLLIDLLEGRISECKSMANEMWMKSKDRNREGRFWSLATLVILEISRKGSRNIEDPVFRQFMVEMRQRVDTAIREDHGEPSGPGRRLVQTWMEIEFEFWGRRVAKPNAIQNMTDKVAPVNTNTLSRADDYLSDRVVLFAELVSNLKKPHFHALLGFVGMVQLISVAYETDLIHFLDARHKLQLLLKAMRLTLRREFSTVPWAHWLLVFINGVYDLMSGEDVRALQYWDKELEYAFKAQAHVPSNKNTVSAGVKQIANINRAWLARVVATKTFCIAERNNLGHIIKSAWVKEISSLAGQSSVTLPRLVGGTPNLILPQ